VFALALGAKTLPLILWTTLLTGRRTQANKIDTNTNSTQTHASRIKYHVDLIGNKADAINVNGENINNLTPPSPSPPPPSPPPITLASIQCTDSDMTPNLVTGEITDGPFRYTNQISSVCTISPISVGHRVRLQFTAFDLESCCDFLKVYVETVNGEQTRIAELSGTVIPSDIISTNPGDSLVVKFITDESVVGQGFRFIASSL
jgi:hypothetical protein